MESECKPCHLVQALLSSLCTIRLLTPGQVQMLLGARLPSDSEPAQPQMALVTCYLSRVKTLAK